MSFTRRKIIVSFGGGITVQNLRVSAQITYAGGMQLGTAAVLIYGMTKDEMNKLSTLGQRLIDYTDQSITIQAGDDQVGMSQVFYGKFTNAWADLQAMPNVVFHVEAQDSTDVVKPSDKDTSATSYSGAVPVEQVISELAGKMGLQFENNGVHVMLDSHYGWGGLRDQVMQAVRAARIETVTQNGILAIRPIEGSRPGIIQVSKETNMVNAPSFTVQGVMVKKLFDVNINHGSKMRIISEAVPVANQVWIINRIDYFLESNMPHGQWFVDLYGANAGMVPL